MENNSVKKSKFLYKNRVENVYKPYYNIFINKKGEPL